MKLIPLTQGQITLVDDEDFEELNQFKWHAHRRQKHYTYYARRGFQGKTISMHRQIMNVPKGQQIDHRNMVGTDNRRCNLRFCTRSQNQMNRRSFKNGSSQFKGVTWHKYGKKWQAQVFFGKKLYYLGYFDSEIEAAKAYDRKAIELFGEFAKLNFVEK